MAKAPKYPAGDSKISKTKQLREMFSNEGVIRIAGVHDGLTAKLVELNGFDGVWDIVFRTRVWSETTFNVNFD